MPAFSGHTELGHGQVAEFITIKDGELMCLCGNDAPNEGFDMSDADGTVIDPPGTVDDDGNERNAAGWDGIHYRCGRCGRIIDQRDGRVVGRHMRLPHMEAAMTPEGRATYHVEQGLPCWCPLGRDHTMAEFFAALDDPGFAAQINGERGARP